MKVIGIVLIFLPALAGAVTTGLDGTGQVLVFPVYSTEAVDTLVTVQNTTAQAKAVRVRFREGAAGASVLEFNLYLNSRERWQAAVTEGELRNDAGQGAFLVQPQPACTAPEIPVLENGLQGVGFLPETSDIIGASQDRTRSGFIEVIEMGTLDAPLVADGRVQCDELLPRFAPDGVWRDTPEQDLSPPTGGLSGHTWLINVTEGQAYSVPAMALTGYTTEIQHTIPPSSTPNLGSGTSAESLVLTDQGWLNLQWESSLEAVAALFMTTYMDVTLDTDPALNAGTSVILTYPTSPFQVDDASAAAPFTEPRSVDGAGEDILANTRAADGGPEPILCQFVLDPSPPAGTVPGLLLSSWVTAELAIDSTTKPVLGVRRFVGPIDLRGLPLVSEAPRPAEIGVANEVSMRILFDASEDDFQCGSANEIVDLGHASSPANVIGGPMDGTRIRLRGLPVLATSFHRVENGDLTVADGSEVRANYGVAFPVARRLVVELDDEN